MPFPNTPFHLLVTGSLPDASNQNGHQASVVSTAQTLQKSTVLNTELCVSKLCVAPCRSHRVLGSRGTNQLGSRLSQAKPQRVTANSCCQAGEKTRLYCRCDYTPFTKSLQDTGPLSDGHSTTGFNLCNVARFQTPSCNAKSPLSYFVLPISISLGISKPQI